MALRVRLLTIFTLLLAVIVFFPATAFPQSPVRDVAKKPKAIKFAELGATGECEFRETIQRFMAELSNNPGYQGYIINYSSVSSPSRNEEIARRERLITNAVSFRHYDRARVTLVRGGARRDAATELWLIPPGAENPVPSGSLDDSPDSVEGPTLYIERGLGDLDEFVLEAVKKREKEEEERERAELARNDQSDDSATDEDQEEASSDGEAPPEPKDPAPTAQNWKDTKRFRWADVGLAVRLANTKGTIGVIIFYADDQRYDIGKLTKFVEQARDFLVQDAKIDRARLRVEFGGYRDSEEAEFWLVGPDELLPKARPDERCEDSELSTDSR